MDLQKLFDMMGNVARDARKGYHLTLGKLGEALVAAEVNGSGDAPVRVGEYYVSNPHSYRGYYADLAFEHSGEPITVSELLQLLRKDVLNQKLEGYKGGEFLMDEETPLWISDYGTSSGLAVVGYDLNGDAFYLETKQLED